MTVQELINELENYPKDLPVKVGSFKQCNINGPNRVEDYGDIRSISIREYWLYKTPMLLLTNGEKFEWPKIFKYPKENVEIYNSSSNI